MKTENNKTENLRQKNLKTDDLKRRRGNLKTITEQNLS